MQEIKDNILKIATEYKLSEQEVESVIEKFNSMDMINPISREELVEAMAIVSKSAKQANLSFNELVSFLSEITR